MSRPPVPGAPLPPSLTSNRGGYYGERGRGGRGSYGGGNQQRDHYNQQQYPQHFQPQYPGYQMNGYQQMNYYGQQTYYNPHFGAPPPLQPAAVAVPTNNISSLFSSSIATRPTGIAAPNTSVPAFAPHNQYQHQQPHSNLVCVPCERTFTQASQLAAHTQTHIKCSFCSLSAAKKVIQLHEEEVHGKVDAAEVPEELKARIGKLETREEIAKWIEERKKNYPTEANVAKKKEEATEQKKKRKEAGLDDERGVCAQFRRGRCSRGNSCRFRHENPNSSTSNGPSPAPFRSLFPPAPLTPRGSKRIPLLQSLLERDVRRERAILLQAVRYVVANGLFEGLEMPKEEEKEEERRPMIEVLSEQNVEEPEPANGKDNLLAPKLPTTKLASVVPIIRAQPAKPATSPALPLADYGPSSSSDSSGSDEEEVCQPAFSILPVPRKKKERPKVDGAMEPGWESQEDEDDKVDFDLA